MCFLKNIFYDQEKYIRTAVRLACEVHTLGRGGLECPVAQTRVPLAILGLTRSRSGSVTCACHSAPCSPGLELRGKRLSPAVHGWTLHEPQRGAGGWLLAPLLCRHLPASPPPRGLHVFSQELWTQGFKMHLSSPKNFQSLCPVSPARSSTQSPHPSSPASPSPSPSGFSELPGSCIQPVCSSILRQGLAPRLRLILTSLYWLA